MRAEDKKKLLMPDPEPRPDPGAGCFLWVGILLVVSLAGAVLSGNKVLIGFAAVLAALAIIGVLAAIKEKSHLNRLREWSEETRRFAIVVTSDSPRWADYISSNWLAKFGEHVTALNYSQKSEWPKSIETEAVRYFDEFGGDHPIVVIPRESGRPAVYRFRAAFVAASHGDEDALKKMEEKLFNEYADWRARN